MFLNYEVNPSGMTNDDIHQTSYFSGTFQSTILEHAISCRPLDSYNDSIESYEYRIAVRAPNNLNNNGYNYHVIYQLSDGQWVGKNDTEDSEVYGSGNPSISPHMWENDAYSPEAGTIYFAVRLA